ncbi:hypothetical protein CHS0354_020220 [Potamilus streckersoni]|uniref:Uncharacterized protein n=1 Tax=Potamilus streckersoni TaxID=2493646 RepID=A0AAE0SKY5_9BIVA|nr:hypothetical protein CHS0354_020220 [Potamilus streckersoni]
MEMKVRTQAPDLIKELKLNSDLYKTGSRTENVDIAEEANESHSTYTGCLYCGYDLFKTSASKRNKPSLDLNSEVRASNPLSSRVNTNLLSSKRLGNRTRMRGKVERKDVPKTPRIREAEKKQIYTPEMSIQSNRTPRQNLVQFCNTHRIRSMHHELVVSLGNTIK